MKVSPLLCVVVVCCGSWHQQLPTKYFIHWQLTWKYSWCMLHIYQLSFISVNFNNSNNIVSTMLGWDLLTDKRPVYPCDVYVWAVQGTASKHWKELWIIFSSALSMELSWHRLQCLRIFVFVPTDDDHQLRCNDLNLCCCTVVLMVTTGQSTVHFQTNCVSLFVIFDVLPGVK